MRSKFISKRESLESAALWVAALLILAIMLELITGWSIGGKSTAGHSINIEPEQFWFEIKLHCSLVLWFIFRSFFTFPFFRAQYNSLLSFREEHTIISNILFYILTPIFVVFLILTLLFISDL